MRRMREKNGYSLLLCCDSIYGKEMGLGLLEMPPPGGKIDPPGDGAAETTAGDYRILEFNRSCDTMLQIRMEAEMLDGLTSPKWGYI